MLEFSRRERWFIGAIYGIPIACLGAALLVAFTHARDWASRHNAGSDWEHWAFAVMIELPALFGLLLMTLWPKIGGGRKPVVPRLLFLSAVVLSFYVQQAYAGSTATGSERFVAGAPSILAGAFLELVFWVMGLVEEARQIAAKEAEEADLKQTRQRLGLGDIATAPTLTLPTVAPDTTPTRDQTPTLPRPDIEPPARPDTTGHGGQTPTGHQPDIPQLSGTMSGSRRQDTPWADLHDNDPDTENAERVVGVPDVLTLDRSAPDTRHETEPDIDEADTGTDVGSEPDTTPKWMTTDVGRQAAAMRRNGATLSAIAKSLGKSERTISRWNLPEPDSTKPVNGHDLTGANR